MKSLYIGSLTHLCCRKQRFYHPPQLSHICLASSLVLTHVFVQLRLRSWPGLKIPDGYLNSNWPHAGLLEVHLNTNTVHGIWHAAVVKVVKPLAMSKGFLKAFIPGVFFFENVPICVDKWWHGWDRMRLKDISYWTEKHGAVKLIPAWNKTYPVRDLRSIINLIPRIG